MQRISFVIGAGLLRENKAAIFRRWRVEADPRWTHVRERSAATRQIEKETLGFRAAPMQKKSSPALPPHRPRPPPSAPLTPPPSPTRHRATNGIAPARELPYAWIRFPGRLAQPVRASRLHRECRGFESLTAHQLLPAPVRDTLNKRINAVEVLAHEPQKDES